MGNKGRREGGGIGIQERGKSQRHHPQAERGKGGDYEQVRVIHVGGLC